MKAPRSQRIGHPLIIGLWGATLFGAVAWALLSGGPERGVASDDVRVDVRTVVFDHGSNAPVVVLQSADHGRALPIWVGGFEAQAIAMEMQGVAGPRPLTHDLLTTIIKELEAEVERVVIDDLRESTYYATIHLRSHGNRLQIDSRPSDAIALALRLESPIFVAGALMTGEAAISLEPGDGAVSMRGSGVTQLWGLTLQDVTGGLAEFFASGNGRGVLVSDVAPGAVADGVQRGDIITELNGDAVGSVSDLMVRARDLRGGSPVHLGLGRQGTSLQVHFASKTP